MNNTSLTAYSRWMLMDGISDRDREVNGARNDLASAMIASADFHEDVKRNGRQQSMMFTRGGEQHSYNVICMPGDQLFAGDIIDAFGQKWIVMEARADDTTHKTGVMYQCNYHVKFQNFTPDVVERWGFLDVSGYSSSFNSDTQLQKSEDQLAIYLPYDCETMKIFVDKRIPSHIGYEANGQRIMFTFKVTGVSPIAESFNCGDHLLMIKAVRDLYAPDRDNIDLMICDYIDPEVVAPTEPVDPKKLYCSIKGKKEVRIGTARTYSAEFYKDDGVTVDDSIDPVWLVQDGSGGETIVSPTVKLAMPDDESAIGAVVRLTLRDAAGRYEPCVMDVEVVGYG